MTAIALQDQISRDAGLVKPIINPRSSYKPEKTKDGEYLLDPDPLPLSLGMPFIF